ncbi:MAG: hypothetical protein RIQ74_695 [Pseudomonadota bacterium]|jgi:hypothetical protein
MMQVNDVPKLSGCMTLSNGQLIGIDQQGNYMPQVSQSDCKKYMNGYRPFDYSSYNRPDISSTEMQQSEISTQINQPKI